MSLPVYNRGSDPFKIIQHPKIKDSLRNFKVLVSKGYIFEVGNCLFCYDHITDLWTIANSDWSCLSVPNNPQYGGKFWAILSLKETGLFTKKKKPTFYPSKGTFEVASDQVSSILDLIQENDWGFKELHNHLEPILNLQPYKL